MIKSGSLRGEPTVTPHTVALALGSNLGDRFANIEIALRLLEVPRSSLDDLPEDANVSVVDTSFMYETAPMYVTDQPRFANCACMIETNLSPMELLRLVKAIETAVGRVPGIRFGPRAVDLDIITYDDGCVDTRHPDERANLDNLIGELVIPHPRMCEREFVLRPLNDMIPDFVHPVYGKPVRTILDELVSAQIDDDYPMFKVIPFPKYPSHDADMMNVNGVKVPRTATYWILSPTHSAIDGRPRKSYPIAILNASPDSSSDGAKYDTVAAGADIIDVSGHSTRPGAAYVTTTEDELDRVLPIIRNIRAHDDDKVRNTLLSINTSLSEVAEQAVLAGANCINYARAFASPTARLPDAASELHVGNMRRIVRKLGVPVVLTHSRGDAGANVTDEVQKNLVLMLREELGRSVGKVVCGESGVRRWLVFVDPGVGFSREVMGEMALKRNLDAIRADEPENALRGYPVLFGESKKWVFYGTLEVDC